MACIHGVETCCVVCDTIRAGQYRVEWMQPQERNVPRAWPDQLPVERPLPDFPERIQARWHSETCACAPCLQVDAMAIDPQQYGWCRIEVTFASAEEPAVNGVGMSRSETDNRWAYANAYRVTSA